MESSSSDNSSSPTSSSEYTTIWSSPPKRPAGRTKFRETRHPNYRGVRRRGNSNRWVCEVREPNKGSRIWVGTFPSADMAARAHDVAVMALRGKSACLNFADSAWLVNLPSSFSSVEELKRVAVRAAEEFNGEVSVKSEVISDENLENFDVRGFEEMGLWSYYASLAEGLLMEPPGGRFGDSDEGENGAEMTLWSY
ncbi:hypothetical protein LUZ60_011796 [Juncus effusus]|nr:hypothetical protein LUZ60_011796 [Juncus effusus]